MSIRKVFDDSAETYDFDRRRLIPCYEDLYAIPLEIIPFHQDRELRVLDLGAGTGLLSAKVAARYPRAQLVLVDLAPAMLQIAEKRFAGSDAGRVAFHLLDYSKQPLKGTYDLIVSALSIHHLPDGDKEALFRKICRVLEPGGLFINADQVLGENAVAEKIYKRCLLQKVLDSGISAEALAAGRERMKEDRMAPLSSQLGWLTLAGFTDVTVWYQYYNFVVFSGTKPLAR